MNDEELDTESRQLERDREVSEFNFKAAQQKSSFQRIQSSIASLVAVGIGIFFIPTLPLAGILFCILGLAKPLGYSLGEIAESLVDATGLSRGAEDSSDNSKKSERTDRDAQPNSDTIQAFRRGKRFNFTVAIYLSSLLLLLIGLLVTLHLNERVQEALVFIIGLLAVATLDAVKKSLE